MVQLFFFIVIAVIITYAIIYAFSCSRHSEPEILTFNSILNAENEVPPTGSDALGTATLIFNNLTKIFTLRVDYSEITLIAAHIHKGEIGVSGLVVFPLDHTKNPIEYTSAPLTLEQEEDLINGLYYVNLHTDIYPAGEIRGQLIY